MTLNEIAELHKATGLVLRFKRYGNDTLYMTMVKE